MHDAVDAGIPVIVYDLALKDSTGVIVTSQSDASMAQGVLDQLVADVGDGAKVGLASTDGFAPLERRKKVWDEVVAEHGLDQLFFTGKVTESTATDNIPLIDAALKANPGSRRSSPLRRDHQGRRAGRAAEQPAGQGQGLRHRHLQRRHRGHDRRRQPLGGTSATDPSAVGAGVVRALALSLAGQLDETSVQFPAITITRDFLLEKGITNVAQLREPSPRCC